MNYKVIFVLMLFIVQGAFAQKQSRADRYFAKGDYINAAENYKLDLEKEVAKKTLQRLAESYYNTYEYKRATLYLALYLKGKYPEEDKSYDNKYNFMMYQLRSALGDHEGALEFLAKYKTGNNDLLNKEAALEEIEALKIKDADYEVKKSRLSSEFADFGAVKVDNSVYFVSDRSKHGLLDKNYKWTHRPFLDIYEAKVSNKGRVIEDPVSFSDDVNSKLHEGNFCFTADGKTMYFSRSNSEKGKQKFDTLHTNQIYLYKTIKNDSVWSTPEKLSFNVAGYSMEHPALNAQGNKLYFASNIPGGKGEFDIYYVDVNLEGSYGTPVNLGDVINTEHREQFPFVSAEDHLFFASNGHLGVGMMDIFVSENVEGGYTKPVNLGVPINSQYDDFSLSYYNDSEGFFSSNRSRANDDIYTFKQIGEIFVKEYIAKFEVRDITTEAYIANAEVSLIDTDEKSIYQNTLDTTAAFTLNILPGTYQFSAKAPGYLDGQQFAKVLEKNEETYVIYLNKKPTDQATEVTPKEPVKTKEDVIVELMADKVGPKVIEREGKLFFDLPPIYFDYDKWSIRADSKKVLDEFALKLEKYKSVHIKISAHTDNRGSEKYNEVLSHKRAEATRNYLALVGYVNARRMKFQGYGESVPIINCEAECTEEEHQLNRRSEFEITEY